MIVFEYFFGLMKIFSPLINGIATRAVGDKHVMTVMLKVLFICYVLLIPLRSMAL